MRRLAREKLEAAVEEASRRKAYACLAADTIVEVADEGRGIEREHLTRIFEPFFTTRKGAGIEEGTGLGLSVSYAIVKEHGGRIEVTSSPGEGARFTVRLPADREVK